MKRCPKCGRSYEDYWKVCLEDGVQLQDMKTIHKPHETGTFKSLSKREAEEEWHRMILFFLTVSLILSAVIGLIVVVFSGSPFSVIKDQEKFELFQTVCYNAGALTAVYLTGAFLTLPISIFWWRRR